MSCGFRRKVDLLRRGICDSDGKVEVTQDRDWAGKLGDVAEVG